MTRQMQITAAMSGRQASAVNDNKLRDAVRFKVAEICRITGQPYTPQLLAGYINAVLQASARTILFEAEVPVALEMGAAGELPDTERKVNQANLKSWVFAYASSDARREAQQLVSLNAARDRARMDAISREEMRRDFEENGIRRAWQSFLEEGRWTFREGYGAALYQKIGKTAIRALLPSDRIAQANRDAVDALRKTYPQRFRTMPADEIRETEVFRMHFAAQLCRAYFETLRDKGLVPREVAQ